MDTKESFAYFMARMEGELPYGWIVCADGTESKSFATVTGGQKVLAELVAAEKIGEKAALEFAQSIEESGLKGEDAELDEFLEELQAKSDGEPPKKMSDELQNIIFEAMGRPKTFRKRKTVN
jgi:hypothetical protein